MTMTMTMKRTMTRTRRLAERWYADDRADERNGGGSNPNREVDVGCDLAWEITNSLTIE
jgi:hypothetical protein